MKTSSNMSIKSTNQFKSMEELLPQQLHIIPLQYSELLFMVEYPRTGGLSGTDLKKVSSLILKDARVCSVFTSFGIKFHSWGPFTLKEESYRL